MSAQRMTGSFRPCQPISAWYRPRPRRSNACKIFNSTEVAVHTEGLVFGRGGPDAWDSAAVGSPVVRCYMGDNEQRWYMWYSGSSKPLPGLAAVAPAAGSVGVAVSFDGISWLRGDGTVEGHRGVAKASDVGIVLAPNTGNWWTLDTAHLAVSDVQVLSSSNVSSGVGVYWMFYSGGDFEAVPAPAGLLGVQEGEAVEGLRMRPGLAMSQDGRNWARIEADHHTGALFDVGQPGEWDSHYIGHPQVVAAGPSDMRMYYHSYDAAAGKFKVGVALSKDGFSWKKDGKTFEGGQAGDFDSGGAAACQVVRDPDSKQFLMFYEAVAADGTRSIGLAMSKDGRSKWQRQPDPILRSSDNPNAWDCGGVGTPCAVAMSGGNWRLYYAGRSRQRGVWEGIGVALGSAEMQNGRLRLTFKRRTGKREPAHPELS